MTAEFRRRKTSARGGFTPAEREKVDELLRLWASLCDFVSNETCRAAEPPSFGDQLPSLTATRC